RLDLRDGLLAGDDVFAEGLVVVDVVGASDGERSRDDERDDIGRGAHQNLAPIANDARGTTVPDEKSEKYSRRSLSHIASPRTMSASARSSPRSTTSKLTRAERPRPSASTLPPPALGERVIQRYETSGPPPTRKRETRAEIGADRANCPTVSPAGVLS